LNIGSIVCSCVSTQKGPILKAIVVDFLNLLNTKSYRHSLFFCVGPRICIFVCIYVRIYVCLYGCMYARMFVHTQCCREFCPKYIVT
jgi:hypothetical protein